MTIQKPAFKRMFETKSMRPYYSVPHIGIAGKKFKDLVGFQYRVLDITSPDMSNEGHVEVSDMAKATEYFRVFWEDEKKVKKLLDEVKDNFKKAVEAENYGWKQNWGQKKTEDLINDMNLFYDLMYKTMTRTIISQPQNVIPLDQKINSLLEKYPNKDEILTAATFFKGDLPWAEEDRNIEELHNTWDKLSENEKSKKLNWLVRKYGWFDDIEGDQPFGVEHYRKKIEEFELESKKVSGIPIPKEVELVGSLIGELGFLRFWSRYHFMTLRYHLKKILAELIKRYGNPDFEFATVEEINESYRGNKIDFEEVRARRNGYATYLIDGDVKMVTGEKVEMMRKFILKDADNTEGIKGITANNGKVTGYVRIISFTAENYNAEVSAFKDREILVTGMTRPQIVHLCQKAAAIVTDEGGITSHAAVVSREFNIPCVMATHNATRLLKTGDLVEVDATNGVVRIIERR